MHYYYGIPELLPTGTLIAVADGSRFTATTGMSVRVRKDGGVWAAGLGTLSIIETNRQQYLPTAAEMQCELLEVAIDHADAVSPIEHVISIGQRVIHYIQPGDDVRAIIEAASAGSLCWFTPGTHTSNGEISVPPGVDIAAENWRTTLLTGDPGSGLNGMLLTTGNNKIESLNMLATGSGHCVQLESGATASDVLVSKCRMRAPDDLVGILSSTGGRQRFTVEDSHMDLADWDGITSVASDASIVARRTLFTGSHFGIYSIMTDQDLLVHVEDCVFDLETPGNINSFPIHIAMSLAARAKVTLINNGFDVRASGSDANGHIKADAGASGTIVIYDLGGNNIDDAEVVLTGAASLQRVTPANTNAAVIAGQVGTDASAAKTAAQSVDTKVTTQRATNLDNLDAAISTRNSVAPLDAAATQTAVESAIDTKRADFTIAGGTAEVPTLADVSAGGGNNTISPKTVTVELTFFPGREGYRSSNVVTLQQADGGTETLAIRPLLNEGVGINSTGSHTVTLVGDATIHTSNILMSPDGEAIHFDIPADSATGEYEMKSNIQTLDGRTTAMIGKFVMK